jgi:hypothetical protein
MREFDVLVAGGGSAGLAAAVSAARRGARTLLVERHGVLGGQAPVALVHSICGLYHLDGDEPVFANPGFASEFATRLVRAGGASGPEKLGRVWVLLTQPAVFAQLAAAMAEETPGLEVHLSTELSAASGDEATLGSGERVRARTMVDATGDGALAALLGAAFEQTESTRLQRPAFIFTLDGVEAAQLEDEGRLRLAHRIAGATRSGALPPGALGASFRGQGEQVFVTIDLDGGPDFDPTDAACLARQEREGCALAVVLADFLRSEAPGFAKSRIANFPTHIGVRESRRVVGRYRLEAADLEQGARFDDAVALATWPMEMRETARGARLHFPVNGQPCEVPLRALRLRDHERVFVAGRCIACSHEAQASLRVIGTCLATGEAAGRAAADLA